MDPSSVAHDTRVRRAGSYTTNARADQRVTVSIPLTDPCRLRALNFGLSAFGFRLWAGMSVFSDSRSRVRAGECRRRLGGQAGVRLRFTAWKPGPPAAC